MLKKTKIELELMSDIDQILMIEKGIRGGNSFVSQRYACANLEPREGEAYEEIAYIDANNLYGLSSSLPMPTRGYTWLKEEEIEELDVASLSDKDETGYILEVDLHYPKCLHDLHNNFPLAPEKRKISHDMTSTYSKGIYSNYSFKLIQYLNIILFTEAYSLLYSDNVNSPKNVHTTERLTATFLPRKKYVVHGMTLKLYIELGLKVTRIHRVLSFQQSYFLKEYVDYCTLKRMSGKTEFAKSMWKLIVNSCFGKFIERVRDYVDCEFVTNKTKARKLISNPRFKSMQIINRSLAIIFLTPKKLYLNKPIAIGFTILDRSKEFMFSKYYKEIQPQLQCNVLYGDTDSLILHVKSNNPTNLVQDLIDIMDFSNYPITHPKHNSQHKNQLGYFKDELCGQKMKKFVSLRAKSYSFITYDNIQTTKLKGVTKAYRKTIPFYNFLNCLKAYNNTHIKQYHIRSRSHRVTTDEVTRLALSSFDANRYILPCGIHSVPYGSYVIKNVVKNEKCHVCNKC